MKAILLAIPDVIPLESRVFEGDRRFFVQGFNRVYFESAIGRMAGFVQNYHFRSAKKLLHGLQFHLSPKVQGEAIV